MTMVGVDPEETELFLDLVNRVFRVDFLEFSVKVDDKRNPPLAYFGTARYRFGENAFQFGLDIGIAVCHNPPPQMEPHDGIEPSSSAWKAEALADELVRHGAVTGN